MIQKKQVLSFLLGTALATASFFFISAGPVPASEQEIKYTIEKALKYAVVPRADDDDRENIALQAISVKSMQLAGNNSPMAAYWDGYTRGLSAWRSGDLFEWKYIDSLGLTTDVVAKSRAEGYANGYIWRHRKLQASATGKFD